VWLSSTSNPHEKHAFQFAYLFVVLEYGAFICAWCMGAKYPRPPGVCGAVDVKYPRPPGVWGAVDVFLLVVIDIRELYGPPGKRVVHGLFCVLVPHGVHNCGVPTGLVQRGGVEEYWGVSVAQLLYPCRV
jgi:hypothetical protein